MRTLSRRIPIRNRGYTVAVQTCGPLACNMFALICDSTKEAAVIDPSCTNPFEFHAFQQFLSQQHGAELKHFLLTHAHPDHIVGVPDVMKHWPQASLYLHSMEEENYQTAHDFGLRLGMPMSDDRLPTPTHDLDDGQSLQVGESIELTVVHTPGHSPGHVAFVDRRSMHQSDVFGNDSNSVETRNGNVESNINERNNGNVVFSGDLLFRGSVGRTDLHNASMEDMFASLRRLYESFDEESIVLSGHTTPTLLKRERQYNPFVDLALQRPKEWYEESKERNNWNDLD